MFCLKNEPGQLPNTWHPTECGAEFSPGTSSVYVVLTGVPIGSGWSFRLTDATGSAVDGGNVQVAKEPSVASIKTFGLAAGDYTVAASDRNGAVLATASFRIALAEPSNVSPYRITPGQGIGALQLGMNIVDAVKLLGSPRTTSANLDGTILYRWYDAVQLTANTVTTGSGTGLEAVATNTGGIIQVTAHYDPRYATSSSVHDGMTEAQVRAAMGPPSRVLAEGKIGHALVYADGIELFIVDDPHILGYGTVVEIVVVPAR